MKSIELLYSPEIQQFFFAIYPPNFCPNKLILKSLLSLHPFLKQNSKHKYIKNKNETWQILLI